MRTVSRLAQIYTLPLGDTRAAFRTHARYALGRSTASAPRLCGARLTPHKRNTYATLTRHTYTTLTPPTRVALDLRHPHATHT
eukprot:7970137-Pyramimonas_sp.AAC.1